MESTSASPRPSKKPAKRSSNACARCRKQKIKCSGLQPCEGCKKRKTACNFDDHDNKVVVSRAYLHELQQKLARSEREQQRLAAEAGEPPTPPPQSAAGGRGSVSAPSVSAHEDDVILDEYGDADAPQNGSVDRTASSEDQDFTNPLTTSPSTFMSASNGRTFYLGTSSNWSFTGRTLQLTHEHLRQASLPSEALLFDAVAYDLKSDAELGSGDAGSLAIPSPDHSIYLINAVKFHCGQMYHLFDDEEFHRNLQQHYSEPHGGAGKSSLWYIHFLVILAFGKIFVMQKATGRRPSGAEFFIKALELLPPATVLCEDVIASTEILCCIALYLQCIDHRNAAHIYIGQAMRTALAYGMHTDMPVQRLGEAQVERCRRIWWTVYILDRQMTSLMGLPQSVHDGNIHCQLPVFPESNQRTTTLDMHIKLARVIAEISNGIYGANGRLNRKFMITTKASLENLAGLAAELGQILPLKLDQAGFGVSRTSASLHLLYHQCIVMATRPLLFCLLKMRLESTAPRLNSSTRSRFGTIVQMCLESARQIIIILEHLQSQGLLETFISMDLDSLYVSSIVLLISLVIDEHDTPDRTSWPQRCLALLEYMESCGNLIAGWRKSEVLHLDEMVNEIHGTPAKEPYPSDIACPTSVFSGGLASDNELFSLHRFNIGNVGNGDDLTADQILAIASSIQEEDAEWMDRAILENHIW